MGHKCFISFKTEDLAYKTYLQGLDIDMVDKSLDEAIDSDNEDYIMRKIREEYLSDSTVTITLIGMHSSENLGVYEQRFIKRELQASLYHGVGNTRSGILGVVLPSMTDRVFTGSYSCWRCGGSHTGINLNDSTVIKEFSYNYYIPDGINKCSWSEDERFCVLVKWEDFIRYPEIYIDIAYKKRSHPIANRTRVRP